MNTFLSPLFANGFFTGSTVHTGLLVGAVVSIVAGPVGVFAVIRGQSFAAEALSDVGAAGASSAILLGVSSLWGFVAAGVAAAGVMELIGIQRPRGRDLATGIVLGAALGLAALFLYLDTTQTSTTGATASVLFGQLFALDTSMVPAIIALSVISVALLVLIGRPLLLSSVNPDLAAARGVPVRLVGALFLLALSLTVSLTALTIGAILGTALVVGPAATALRLVKRPLVAMFVASALGVLATWLAIVLAYDSYSWPPAHSGWPVSFFVVGVVLVMYVLASVPEWRRARRAATVPVLA
jgi:zinc/manganese transport system permease protein